MNSSQKIGKFWGDKRPKEQAYPPCSLGAIETNLRLGERRTLKLRVCNSFTCWCCTVVLKESTEEEILDVRTTSWVFVETFVECSSLNRVWVISKRCSMKIREGKSISMKEDTEHETPRWKQICCYNKPCPMFLCDCKSIATILALSREIQCESHSLTLSKVDLLV